MIVYSTVVSTVYFNSQVPFAAELTAPPLAAYFILRMHRRGYKKAARTAWMALRCLDYYHMGGALRRTRRRGRGRTARLETQLFYLPGGGGGGILLLLYYFNTSTLLLNLSIRCMSQHTSPLFYYYGWSLFSLHARVHTWWQSGGGVGACSLPLSVFDYPSTRRTSAGASGGCFPYRFRHGTVV